MIPKDSRPFPSGMYLKESMNCTLDCRLDSPFQYAPDVVDRALEIRWNFSVVVLHEILESVRASFIAAFAQDALV